METDKLLVRQVLNGNIESFEQLLNKYYHKIVTFIFKMGLLREDSEDITQEVFVKAYNNLYRYDEKWEFSTWLFNIAINSYKDFKKKKRPVTTELLAEHETAIGFNNEEPADKIHMRQVLKRMLVYLDTEVKSMLILHYFNGFSLKEIGNIYKTTPDAVKMKIYRARNKLAKTFGNNLNDFS